jgi:hypothetical protein
LELRVLLQIGGVRKVNGNCDRGELRGDSEYRVDELPLAEGVILRYPADLAFSDCLRGPVRAGSHAGRGLKRGKLRNRTGGSDLPEVSCPKLGEPEVAVRTVGDGERSGTGGGNRILRYLAVSRDFSDVVATDLR